MFYARLIVLIPVAILMAMTACGGADGGDGPEVEPLLTMIDLPAGAFEMGSPESEAGRLDDELLHTVTLTQPFAISQTEITQAEWQAVMGTQPSTHLECGEECPAESMNWMDALEFCNRLSQREGFTPCYLLSGAEATWERGCDGYRLATEAEWEYAARAGSASALPNGEEIQTLDHSCVADPSLEPIAWYCGNTTDAPQPVGGKAPNAWGLYDMIGNVREWVWDRYGAYPNAPATDPLGPDVGANHVVRGGSFNNNPPWMRSASRREWPTEIGVRYTGLRVAQDR